MNSITVHQLLQWVTQAQAKHEELWTTAQRVRPLAFQAEILTQTQPSNARDVDFQLAQILLRDYWNVSQSWEQDYNRSAPQLA